MTTVYWIAVLLASVWSIVLGIATISAAVSLRRLTREPLTMVVGGDAIEDMCGKLKAKGMAVTTCSALPNGKWVISGR